MSLSPSLPLSISLSLSLSLLLIVFPCMPSKCVCLPCFWQHGRMHRPERTEGNKLHVDIKTSHGLTSQPLGCRAICHSTHLQHGLRDMEHRSKLPFNSLGTICIDTPVSTSGSRGFNATHTCMPAGYPIPLPSLYYLSMQRKHE